MNEIIHAAAVFAVGAFAGLLLGIAAAYWRACHCDDTTEGLL